MKADITETTIKLAQQQKIIKQLGEENRENRQEIDYLKERIDLLLAHIYSKKSERLKVDPDIPGQISYMEDLAEEPPSADEQ